MNKTAFFYAFEKAYYLFLIIFPFAVVFSMAFIYLHMGVDLPNYDDWRAYISGNIGSFSLSHLFKSENDTLYPVGKFLDSVAQRTLRGNSVAYQFLSMIIVLGSILWFQWKLLSATIDDKFVVACSFFATLFMLQPGSYWGYQNLAYHQAIPLMCLLASLYVIVCVNRSIYAKMAILFILGLVSGLAYISGAFSILVSSIVLLIVGRFVSRQKEHILAGMALGSAGLITSFMQAMVIIVDQHGKPHRQEVPWAFPSSSDFWMYLFGKIARSLQLPQQFPALSFAMAVLITGGAGWLLYRGWARARSGNARDAKEINRLCITLVLAAAIMIYLAMVAAGRANFRGYARTGAPLDIFLSAYPRFHFFWVCLIWPWVIAALLQEMRTRFDRSTVRALAGMGGIVLFAWVLGSGGLNHRSAFEQSSIQGQQGIACLQRQLITSDRILCPDLFPGDLTKAYAFAVATGASFVKYVPPSLKIFNPSPEMDIFRLSGATFSRLAFENAEASPGDKQSIDLAAQHDPMIIFSTENPEKMRNCQTLLLRASVEGKADEFAQLFFFPPGSAFASEVHSASASIDEKSPVEITVSSRNGFENKLRFDPISRAGSVRVSDLSVRCLIFRQ